MTTSPRVSRRRRPRSNERGVMLVIFVLLGAAMLGLMALILDFGVVFMTRNQAATAAEASAARAAQEMYLPDYGPAFALGGAPPNWSPNGRETPARDAARATSQFHPVGPGADFQPYYGDVHVNAGNVATGDVRLGTWGKAAGGAFSFTPITADITSNASLPRAVEVTVRRTAAAEIALVADGANAVPYVLGRIPPPNPSGLGVKATYISALAPAAMVGAGAEIPVFPGTTTRTGVMPMVIIYKANVATWLAGGPGTNLRFDLDRSPSAIGGGAEEFLTDFGMAGTYVTNVQSMLRFLRNVGGAQTPPPMVRLDDLPSRENMTNAEMAATMAIFAANFDDRTWVVPVVANNLGSTPATSRLRVIGFARVYCTSVDSAGPTYSVTLQVAATAGTRNVGSLGTCRRSYLQTGAIPANIAAGGDILARWQAAFWTTVDGFQVASNPFGVASTNMTVRTR